MITYYLDLARRSFKRSKALTLLMVVAIAFGVGASMTTLTVMHVLSADPIPGHSHQLYYVQLDPRPLKDQVDGEDPVGQSTRRDAENLVRAGKADRQLLTTGGSAAIEPQRADLRPFFVDSRWTSADFFPMFRTPFVAGGGWSSDDDLHAARVAVISRSLAEKLFGTTDVIGKPIRVERTDLRIVGVLDTWQPAPHFYDLTQRQFGRPELLFVPFSTSRELRLSHTGNMTCWSSDQDSPQDQEAVGAPCEWIQVWVELSTPAKAAAYRDYLVSYSREQKRVGNYLRDPNVRLRDVIEWLTYNKVVPADARLQTWVALGFLLVCLVNTVGLLLTKFLRRSQELGVRRALGASKRSIFAQLLVEAGAIGLVGGTLGLGLAYLGLWAVRHQPTDYADLARLDLPMLAATFALTIGASLLAGLLPAWRGCQVAPALQLKSH